jgi:hypothetical protein
MPELAFLAPHDPVSRDLAAALCREVERQDAAALLAAAPPPPRPDRVYVAVEEEGMEGVATPDPRRTILVALTSPADAAFEQTVERAREAGAVFHVNYPAIERLRQAGVPARHLQLGFAEGCRGFDPAAAPELEVIGGRYFDWPRAARAIHRGAVVLHRHALGVAPLVPGRHLFVGAEDSLDVLAEALRQDRDRLAEVRLQALEFLRDALPLSLAAGALLGAARALVAQPLAGASSIPGQTTSRSK